MINAFIQFATGIIYLVISLTIFNQVILRKLKSVILTDDNDYKLSYLILYSGLFLAFAISYYSISDHINYAVTAFSNSAQYSFFILVKNLSILVVLNVSWVVVLFFIRFFLLNLLMVDADDMEEMNNNNYLYFILSSVILISLILIFNNTLLELATGLTDKVVASVFN